MAGLVIIICLLIFIITIGIYCSPCFIFYAICSATIVIGGGYGGRGWVAGEGAGGGGGGVDLAEGQWSGYRGRWRWKGVVMEGRGGGGGAGGGGGGRGSQQDTSLQAPVPDLQVE